MLAVIRCFDVIFTPSPGPRTVARILAHEMPSMPPQSQVRGGFRVRLTSPQYSADSLRSRQECRHRHQWRVNSTGACNRRC